VSKAQCQCGRVELETLERPYAIVVCHCSACKRRTGSALGVGVYFNAASLKIAGKVSRFDRSVEDRIFSSFFCPNCGTSVYWRSDLHPDGVGIGLGCFEDPSEFSPDRSVWERKRLDWLQLESIPGHVEGRQSERLR